jgi:hypothetical protein
MMDNIYFKNNKITWVLYQGALIPADPPSKDIYLSKEDIDYLLKISKAYFLRWVNNWDCKQQTEWWYIIKDGKSSFDELSSNTRNQIRKGQKNCDVKKVPAEYICQYGYDIYKKAFVSYKTFLKPLSREVFQESITQRQMNQTLEYWGGWDKSGNFISYAENVLQESMCTYSTIKYDPEYLKLYPGYALIFEMNNYYLNELKLEYVNDGSRSISHETNIQDYLIQKFKFRKAYCNLNIVYSKKIKLLVSLLFPFLRFFENRENSVLQKLYILLFQEKIRRTFI